MSQRFKVVLPDEVSRQLEQLATARETTEADIMARALELHAAAFQGRRDGLAVGLADPKTRVLQREFVGP